MTLPAPGTTLPDTGMMTLSATVENAGYRENSANYTGTTQPVTRVTLPSTKRTLPAIGVDLPVMPATHITPLAVRMTASY